MNVFSKSGKNMNLVELDIRIRRLLWPVVHRNTVGKTTLELAQALGMKHQSYLDNAVNENLAGQFNLNVPRFVKLLDITGDPTPLAYIAGKLGFTVTKLQTEMVTDDDLKTKNLRLAKELGELSGKIIDALEDGQVNDSEWKKIEKEKMDVAVALSRISRPGVFPDLGKTQGAEAVK